VSGRAVIDRRTVHVHDLSAETDEEYSLAKEFQRRRGHHTILVTPLLSEGIPLGMIGVYRTEVRAFSDAQIKLLETFADQAVIAIENVRLFTELEARNTDLTESLEQQTATSEILRVISQSPTDVQPVFETIVRNATKLCDGTFSAVFRWDGALVDFAAAHNWTEQAVEAMRAYYPIPATRETGSGRAILDRAVVQIADIEQDPEYRGTVALAVGFRSGLFVPMMREGTPVGAISVGRAATGPFSNGHVELLKTFADQAVIAIENVRLFKELETRNHDLTEALDRQTATAEVLRVISQSQSEVQPVFDAIADNAMRLFRAWSVAIIRSDGQLTHLLALRGGLPGSAQSVQERFPIPIHESPIAAHCLGERTIVHIADIESESDPVVKQRTRDIARERGYRSILYAPMLREGQAMGVIAITRAEAGRFSPVEIALLQTFADQAVIAIENARLLGELRARTGELTRSVEELTALGDVSRALSSTLDVDVVLDTVVARANELTGADGCTIFEYDEGAEEFHLRATRNLEPRLVEIARAPVRRGEGILGRVATTREPVQVADITAPAYRSPFRDVLVEAGYRSILGVPLVREEHLVGVLTVNRKVPGEFPPEVIELLKTFATQSALAIQNARLFREIADKSAQLEAASRHKSEFLANMSHELRTPLNAIIGFSEVLNERMFGELNEKQDEYLKDIYASGQHLLSLINDILDLSKIEAGRMELELAEFDLPSAIDNALILVRERATRRGITLGRTIDERLGTLQGDERKVKQVLLNLLSNALKFSPEGGRIDVSARAQDGVAEIAVTDTGVGIAPEDQEAVFEEFRQVGTADKKVEGTGLGLALSRKFIELHGGRIWVKSAVGVGSTFTFTLPFQR